MAAVSTLLAVIAAATGPTDYPVRIGMTASTLEALARTRLGSGVNELHSICSDLYGSATGGLSYRNKMFGDDDTKIIGFFLGRNTMRTGSLR